MNPRDRRLRLRKSTVRNLNPGNASAVKGGTIQLETKKTSENMQCGTMQGPGCVTNYLCDPSEGFTCPLLWTCDDCPGGTGETCGTCDQTCFTCDQATCPGASCNPCN